MTTIVMNTMNAAVSEYDWQAQSLTATHMGSNDGLFEFGGNLDDDQPIAAGIETGKTQWGISLKKGVDMVYLAVRGVGKALLTVIGQDRWSYSVTLQAAGESRAQPGMGIVENYLGFAFDNVAGADFVLDGIEADIRASTSNRRTGK